MKHLFFFVVVFFSLVSYAQKTNEIYNIDAIRGFYNNLNALENGTMDKVRITQIGDSHIQGLSFSGRMRDLFQSKFGNGGIGFVFPYKLAKTNGSNIKFTSNAEFEATRNIFADSTDKTVGLSGYSFVSNTENTAIKLSTKDFPFNTIKIISPKNLPLYKFAHYTSTKDFNSSFSKKAIKYYTIKSGDYLSKIARKFNTTVKRLKKNNNLKSNSIYSGKKLKIEEYQLIKPTIDANDFSIISNTEQEFSSQEKINEIYLFHNNKEKNIALNGLVLENNETGIIYNAIGVNGAKCKDYNKFELFTEQLKKLNSNLIIISLGTNESFYNTKPEVFLKEFLELISTLKAKNPNADFLVTTPPPSLLKKHNKNNLIVDYATLLKDNMYNNNYAVWDLYHAIGGHQDIQKNYKLHLVARDRIHYTKLGYEMQADLFFKALIQHR